MNKIFSDVQQFMEAAGQTVPPFNADESAQSELYQKLINEEYVEFTEARNNNDDVETLDACFDMMWVIIGYVHSRGWDIDAAWEEGCASNMSKIDKESGKVLKREDGKILKPDTFQEPDFSKFVS